MELVNCSRFDMPFLWTICDCTSLLHWHYSPMRAFASIMNLFQTFPRTHSWFPNRQFLRGGPAPSIWRIRSHITPGTGRSSYTPRHWVPIVVTFFDIHGLRWDYSLIPVTPRVIVLVKLILFWWIAILQFPIFIFVYLCVRGREGMHFIFALFYLNHISCTFNWYIIYIQ